MGAQALIRALAEHTGAPADHVIAGNGSVALCQQLVQATAGEGDEVVFGWRSFEAYPIVTQITGATAVRVPVTVDHELDLFAISEAVNSQTRLIFVCTPNNPTGTAIRRDGFAEFLDTIPQDVLVVIDEAYREFDVSPDSPDGLDFAVNRPNVVSLRTLSKAYGLAGLRVEASRRRAGPGHCGPARAGLRGPAVTGELRLAAAEGPRCRLRRAL